jgi:dTDP-4-dehydrorhamnose reductase
MKIALTGASGLVGSRLVELLNNDFEFIALSSKDFDIKNQDQVSSVLSSIDFDMFLHLAAYTNVDGAETNQEEAYAMNVKGTENIFNSVQSKGKKMIYTSTDFVFDGKHPPYDENSKENPLSIYAKSKYDGEQLVKDTAMIVRLAYPYRATFEPKKDFMRVLKWFLEQGKDIKGITDSIFVPTFIDDFAFGLKYLMNNFSPEVFHLVGSESLSPYEAAKMIARKFNLNEELIQSTTYAEFFAGKAQRPQYSEIKSVKNTFHHMKSFEEGLDEIVRQSR